MLDRGFAPYTAIRTCGPRHLRDFRRVVTLRLKPDVDVERHLRPDRVVEREGARRHFIRYHVIGDLEEIPQHCNEFPRTRGIVKESDDRRFSCFLLSIPIVIGFHRVLSHLKMPLVWKCHGTSCEPVRWEKEELRL